jgi:hypothetical protein
MGSLEGEGSDGGVLADRRGTRAAPKSSGGTAGVTPPGRLDGEYLSSEIIDDPTRLPEATA